MPEPTEGFTVSDRGFKHYNPIHPTPTSEIRVYESSNARVPSLWVSITNLHAPPSRGGTSESIQLSLEQARELRNALDYAINFHYQTEGGK